MRAPICPRKAAKGNYSLLAALSSGSLPLVVVTRHHPLLLRVCVLSGTATYGAARTVVYILFPILPPGASKPRNIYICIKQSEKGIGELVDGDRAV